MRSPQTIGLECASPGMAVFHATFFEAPTSQLVGTVVVDTPSALAPRNAGQFDCALTCTTVAPKSTQEVRRAGGMTWLCFNRISWLGRTPHACHDSAARRHDETTRRRHDEILCGSLPWTTLPWRRRASRGGRSESR